MSTIALSTFRSNASAFLAEVVDHGRSFRILRHGKPVADLKPVEPEADTRVDTEIPAWKRPITPVTLKPIPGDPRSAAQRLLDDRGEY